MALTKVASAQSTFLARMEGDHVRVSKVRGQVIHLRTRQVKLCLVVKLDLSLPRVELQVVAVAILVVVDSLTHCVLPGAWHILLVVVRNDSFFRLLL